MEKLCKERRAKVESIKNNLMKMNATIKETEDHLRSFAFVQCSYNDLEFKKSPHGSYRIFYGNKPLLECSVEDRVKAMFNLKGLAMTVEDRCQYALGLVVE